ncbi:hypothetical protein [Sporocytophaga myxococcoides]|uniref:hypothetical protein n=1 Tax=Sporocytophaga myxococcoides TaxID=153721 RepID=UPI0004014CBF|nr:hypothetical protein [Sporocytophaga myxococcoides]
MKKNKLLAILFSAFIAFGSCNQKEQVPGPQGPPGKDAINPFIKKEGFVKGKMYVTDEQGADSLVGDFNYEYTTEPFVQSKYIKGENGSFNIVRSDSSMIRNNFNLTSYKSPILGPSEIAIVNFSYEKDLGNGKYLTFGKNIGVFGTPEIKFSNYTFNENNGRMKFDFIILYPAFISSNGRESKVVGSADVVLIEAVSLRKGELSN